jgi:hypothetical protein
MRYLIALLLLSCGASVQAQTATDGYAWAKWDQGMRLGFVSGYLQATDMAATAELATGLNMLNYLDHAKVSLEKWENMCLSDKTNDFTGLTMGQFVDGVDVFYRDSRNRNLEVGFALQYVRDQARGKTSQELSVELAHWQSVTQESAKHRH